MTENTAVTEAAESTESTEEISFVEIPGTLMPFVPVLKGFVTQANELAAAIRQATSGDAEQVSALINSDDRFGPYRNYREEIAAQIAELSATLKEADNAAKTKAKELLPELAGIDVESAKAEYMALRREKVVPLEKAIVAMSSPDVLDAIYVQHNISPVIGVGRNSTSATGAPKFRFNEMSINGEEVTPKTISKVAAVTGLANEDVLAAFKVAADNDNLREVADQTFKAALTGADSKVYEIEFTPKG